MFADSVAAQDAETVTTAAPLEPEVPHEPTQGKIMRFVCHAEHVFLSELSVNHDSNSIHFTLLFYACHFVWQVLANEALVRSSLVLLH